jgi:hypothetical protein
MTPPPDPNYRHRFPAEIISHAVWLYHVFRTPIFSIACSTRYLHLRLLDMHLDALAQHFSAGFARSPLHAAQCLLFGAVGVL